MALAFVGIGVLVGALSATALTITGAGFFAALAGYAASGSVAAITAMFLGARCKGRRARAAKAV